MHRVMQDHIGLIMSGELLYWAKWPLTGKIILLIVIALPIYVYYQYKNGSHDFGRQMKGAWWLMFYLIALAGVSLVGSTKFGGLVYLAFGWDPAVVAVIGLAVFLWGVKSGWRTPSVEAIREEAQDHPHQNQLLSPTSTLSNVGTRVA